MCALYTCLVPKEARRGCRVPQNWSQDPLELKPQMAVGRSGPSKVSKYSTPLSHSPAPSNFFFIVSGTEPFILQVFTEELLLRAFSPKCWGRSSAGVYIPTETNSM